MKNKTLQSWLIAAAIAVGSAGLIYAASNSVTGEQNDTDFRELAKKWEKFPTKLKRFEAGLKHAQPTPIPAGGLDGGWAWAADLAPGNVLVISSDDAAKGVQLATGDSGDIVLVINVSATAANCFPASGGKINGGATNGAVVIPASKGILAVCLMGDYWYAFDLTARATVSATPTPTASPTATVAP